MPFHQQQSPNNNILINASTITTEGGGTAHSSTRSSIFSFDFIIFVFIAFILYSVHTHTYFIEFRHVYTHTCSIPLANFSRHQISFTYYSGHCIYIYFNLTILLKKKRKKISRLKRGKKHNISNNKIIMENKNAHTLGQNWVWIINEIF